MFNVGSVQGYLKLDTKSWTTSVKKANSSLKTLSHTFTIMGATALGSIALITREFGKFDKAIRHATSVSETTSKQFEQMSDMALDASVKWNKAATSTAQAFYYLGSAGLTVTEQMQAFNTTIMLSRAMGSDLAKTVEGTVDIVRAFGLEFANINSIADQLTKTVISSNQTFDILTRAMTYAASTAKMTNNTLAETSAMLGIMANAGIKGCYDDQTEVLTRRGWLPWRAVVKDDAFATVNPSTGFIEYQKPERLIRYHHKGKMYHVANRGIDLCVTPDHRMWVKKRDHDDYYVMTAKEVDGKNVQYKAGGMHWHGFDPEHIELKGFSQNRGSWAKKVSTININAELWATFLGWYISEGSCDYRKGCYRVRITQNQGPIRDKMREVLSKLPVTVNEDKNGFIINNEQIWRAVEHLGKAPQKHIPQYALDWSPRLLNILLDSLMEGDGDCNECYYTSSKRLADQIMELALKIGVSATAVIKSEAGTISNYDKEGREIKARYDQWKISIKREHLEPAYYPSEYTGVHGDRLDGSKFPAVSEWIDYDGEVFCAEVPNHLLIVRRNGKILVSGNSMAGTVLRRAMANLMAPMGAMRGLIYELGLEIYDSTGKMKPFVEIIGEISDKLKGTSDEYKNLVFRTLFGVRALAGQIRLFDVGSVAIKKYADEIKNAGNITQTVAEKQMKALTEQMGKLWRQMQKIAIITGQELAPAMKRIVDRLLDQTKALEGYIKSNIDAIATTLKWVAVISALAVGVPIMVSIVAGVLSLINPFTVVIGTLYLLRTVWEDTFRNGGVLNKSLDEFGDVLSKWADKKFGVLDKILRTMWTIGMAAPKGYKAIWDLSGQLADMVVPVDPRATVTFEDVVKKGKTAAAEVGKMAIKQLELDMEALFGNTDKWMKKLLPAKWSEGIETALATLKDLIDLIMDEPIAPAVEIMTGHLTKFGDTMGDVARKGGIEIGELTVAWRRALQEMFQPMEEDMVKWHGRFVNVLGDIRSQWTSTFENMMNTGTNWKDFMEEMFLGVLRSFNRMIAEIAANDLLYAMTGSKGGRTEKTTTLWDLVPAGLKTLFGGAQPEVPTTGIGGRSYREMMSDAYMGVDKVAITLVNESGTPLKGRIKSQKTVAGKTLVNMILEEMDTNPNAAARIRGG